MKKNPRLPGSFLIIIISLCMAGCADRNACSTEGEMKTWHTITLSIHGPHVGEQEYPNPFLNYRLIVEFSRGSKLYRVPGFYAADGHAAETGAESGDIWKVRLKPDQPGTWTYRVYFREGEAIAINEDPSAGTPLAPDSTAGSFEVSPSDKEGRDFRAHGRLEYVGERYLRFSGTGNYFLKGGADSPENFLAYHEFDGTGYGGDHQTRMGEDSPNADLHTYSPHIRDWTQGDPLWQNGKGKGIIGAVNYLASKGMNSIYFLTMNVLGDGDDVWPWTGRNERYRFDCSRLDQWEILFSHMEKLGVMMHVVLQETENECLLDGGRLDVQRKLYLRELIARYAHHLAITWNIGEENGPARWTPVGQTMNQRREMMAYIHQINPYSCFVVSHTHAADPDHSDLIEPLLGHEEMNGPSLQLSPPSLVHEYTGKWIRLSAENGFPWVVCSDELGPHWMGVMPDSDDPMHDTIRKEALWGNLMAGGGGVEWYFGYRYVHSDLNCEDWRSRESMWDQTRIALEFFHNYLPYQDMEGHDQLVSDGYCLASPGKVYAIYMKNGGPVDVDLTGYPGPFSVAWFDPRNGGALFEGKPDTIHGGGVVRTVEPPSQPDQDWICLISNPDS